MLNESKAVIKSTDMNEIMQKDAIAVTIQAMEKYNTEQQFASYISSEFNKKYKPVWHCFVGKKFAAITTHETGTYIYFYLGQTAVVLFKLG